MSKFIVMPTINFIKKYNKINNTNNNIYNNNNININNNNIYNNNK